MVQAGEDTALIVKIQCRTRNTAIEFSYKVRLSGMKYGEDSVIDISYDSRIQPLKDDKAILRNR